MMVTRITEIASSPSTNYGPNAPEVVRVLAQLQLLNEPTADALIIAMRKLELASSIGANDDLARLWEARGHANELIRMEFADAWQNAMRNSVRCFDSFWQTSAIVAASTDALLGAVCRGSLQDSDYEVLTDVWHQVFGSSDPEVRSKVSSRRR